MLDNQHAMYIINVFNVKLCVLLRFLTTLMCLVAYLRLDSNLISQILSLYNFLDGELIFPFPGTMLTMTPTNVVNVAELDVYST